MSKQIRILHILSALDGGGVEMMLQNYCTKINDDKIIFDFAVHGTGEGDIEKQMKQYGFSVFHLTPKRVSLRENIRDLQNVIKKGNYDIVHVHQNSISFVALAIAKINGVKIRIVHAHGLGGNKEPIIVTSKKMFYRVLNFITATDFWACGENAGTWLYGKRWHKLNGKYIMHNSIDVDKFIFDEQMRINTRRTLNFEGKRILIYVARMEKGKNQEFLLPVMRELPDNYHLLLIGNGKTESFIKSKVLEEGLENKITALGRRADIPALLCASDLFLFPSLHEGLGIVAIEAQANGLPIIASTGIPDDTYITDIIKYVELDTEKWVNAILEAEYNEALCRKDYNIKVCEAGYSVNNEVEKYKKKIYNLKERKTNNGDNNN